MCRLVRCFFAVKVIDWSFCREIRKILKLNFFRVKLNMSSWSMSS